MRIRGRETQCFNNTKYLFYSINSKTKPRSQDVSEVALFAAQPYKAIKICKEKEGLQLTGFPVSLPSLGLFK